MQTTCLSLYIPTPSTNTITKLPNPNSKTPLFRTKINGIRTYNNVPCRGTIRACACSRSGSITDFDLYDILGVHSTSEQSEIKRAYRSLQKRCHPDIAGPVGHDMAIVLNDTYAVLSDPSSRLAYDKEQAKTAEFRGYSGKPLYSAWFGPESEERAVFVDEVKCVGCLKCALFAEKTFAIESVYGRARVVAQWADPEYKIEEAIGACPVNCISFVERSNLAALEYLMSKQPRGNVRVGAGTTGVRVPNIFTDVRKFQTRYQKAKDKASGQNSKETDHQRAARMSAIQTIRSISNWIYWQIPNSGGSTVSSHQHLTKTAHKSTEPDIGNLRKAAAARKKLTTNRTPAINYLHGDDYWTASLYALPAASTEYSSHTRIVPEAPATESKKINDKDNSFTKRNRRNSTSLVIPLGTGMIAALIAQLHGEGAVGQLEEHVGGSFMLQIVNSSWLPVILTGITWYVIGILAVGFIETIRSREN